METTRSMARNKIQKENNMSSLARGKKNAKPPQNREMKEFCDGRDSCGHHGERKTELVVRENIYTTKKILNIKKGLKPDIVDTWYWSA